MQMRMHHRIAAGLLAALLTSPTFALYERAKAIAQTESLTQEQIDRSWEFFVQGFEAAQRGDTMASITALRSGLAINPAQLEMHVLVASQFELAGATGKAWAHYGAAGTLDFRHPQGEAAIKNMRRLSDRLRNKVPVTKCVVMGYLTHAYATACDE